MEFTSRNLKTVKFPLVVSAEIQESIFSSWMFAERAPLQPQKPQLRVHFQCFIDVSWLSIIMCIKCVVQTQQNRLCTLRLKSTQQASNRNLIYCTVLPVYCNCNNNIGRPPPRRFSNCCSEWIRHGETLKLRATLRNSEIELKSRVVAWILETISHPLECIMLPT